MLQIYLLGAPTILRDGNPVQGFVSHKATALIYYLAATAQPHTRETLTALLWPDAADAQAKKNLRDILSNLRRSFANELLITRQSVAFQLSPQVEIDCHLLMRTLEDARGEAASTMLLHRLRTLYRGDFLAGFQINEAEPFETWLRDEREHLRQRVGQVLHGWVDAALTRGDHPFGIEAANQLLTLEPWSEITHRHLMTLLAASGQRGAALAQFERCRTILAEELGVEPEPATFALYERISSRTEKPRHNLPVAGQLSPFVGRTQELTDLQQLLRNQAGSGRVRLLTLLGLGGVGKTRLAIALGAKQLHHFFDGVYFVSLAALTVSDDSAVAAAIAQALGLPLRGQEKQTTSVLQYLRDKTLLLILDNVEQLLPTGSTTVGANNRNTMLDFLAEILRTAPEVQVIVTSLERLQLQGEWLFPVQGLPTPPQLDTSQAEHFDAVQLFLQHARRVWPAFQPNAYDLQAIARICQAVAGLPLAIELAAAWVQMLPCHELATEIENTLAFLESSLHDIPARHRSLRAVFDYSWRLLGAADQRALTQLTVFRGSFDRRAAQQILGVSLPQLTSLVNKSLLQTVSAGRYGLHELVRQFAAETLDQQIDIEQSAKFQAIHRRHCTYYLDQLGAYTPQLFGREPHKATLALQNDLDNLRQAWQFAVAHKQHSELISALPGFARFYELVGLIHEAVARLQTAYEQLPETHHGRLGLQLQLEWASALTTLGDTAAAITLAEPLVEQARTHGAADIAAGALFVFGVARYRQGDQARAQQTLTAALVAAQTIPLPRLEAETLLSLGDLLMYQADPQGQRYCHQALAHFQQLGDRRGEANAINNLGVAASLLNEWQNATDFFEQALQIYRQLGDAMYEGRVLNNLAIVHTTLEAHAAAERCLEEALRLTRTTGYRSGEANVLLNLGSNQADQGKRVRARLLYEEGLALARQIGYARAEGAFLNNLGDLANDDGDYERAQLLIQTALAVARTSGDRYFEAQRLRALGDALRWQGNYALAHEQYQQATALAHEIGDSKTECQARIEIGRILRWLGDPPEAESQLRQGLALARQLTAQADIALALAALGQMAIQTHADPGGLSLLDEALQAAQASNNPTIEALVLVEQGRTWRTLRQFDQALTALTTSLSLLREQPSSRWLPLPLTELAIFHWQTQKPRLAQADVEEILQRLGNRPVGGVDHPVAIYRICAQALAATDEPRAAALRTRAAHHLAQQVAPLVGESHRQTFLAQIEADFGPLSPVACADGQITQPQT